VGVDHQEHDVPTDVGSIAGVGVDHQEHDVPTDVGSIAGVGVDHQEHDVPTDVRSWCGCRSPKAGPTVPELGKRTVASSLSMLASMER
jgi:hypothetical protein